MNRRHPLSHFVYLIAVALACVLINPIASADQNHPRLDVLFPRAENGA